MEHIWRNPLFTEVPIELRPMIPGFIERREKETKELNALLNALDFPPMKDIGHRLKGTGGGYGFPIISDLGRELESAAQESDSTRAKHAISQLTEIVKKLKETLEG